MIDTAINGAIGTSPLGHDDDPFRNVVPLPPPESSNDVTHYHHQVIVAGAGPTGLLLGCRLREMGVDVALVDPHLSAGTGGSKAAVTMPRSLEVMGPEIADELHGSDGEAGAGRRVRSALIGSGGEWVGTLAGFSLGVGGDGDAESSPLACRYGPLAVGQDEVERALARRYTELGGTIYHAARVSSIEEDEDGVSVGIERSVYVRPPATAPEMPPRLASSTKSTVLRARFAVGSDGKRSSVREMAGIKYDGKDYPQLFFLADIEIDNSGKGWGEEAARLYMGMDGTFLLFVRRGGNNVRTYLASDGIDPKDCTEEFIRAYWERFLPGGDLGVKVVSFGSPSAFKVSCCIASTYSSQGGRVLLAGDAAHCHSPAGGQGMNTGLQDSANLAWKLADALNRGAGGDDPLLATYEAERRPVAEWVLSTSDGAFGDMTRPSSPVTSWIRNALLRAVLRLVPAGSLPPRHIRDRIFGLSISYRDAGTCTNSGEGGNAGLFGLSWPSTPRLVAGDRLPNLRYCHRGSNSEERLYDLIGSSSSKQTLIVVSCVKTSAKQKAEATSACVKAASSMGNVSCQVLSVGGRKVPTRSDGILSEENKEESASEEVTVVELEVPFSPSTPTLANMLGLSETGVAILAIRPDSHISFVHRGACSEANIKEGLRLEPKSAGADTHC
mmetsp:Transcript_29296/g.49908  ORF Transcript_29296/g.49908 Transcript_29296/m.49908 type:complete len:670 (-) Transcript_29296:3190-5199(-)